MRLERSDWTLRGRNLSEVAEDPVTGANEGDGRAQERGMVRVSSTAAMVVIG